MKFVMLAAIAAAALCTGAAQAKTDPLLAGAKPGRAAPSIHLNAASMLSVIFTVNFEGGSYQFPGSLVKGKGGSLTGTVTAPSGCAGTVNAGSVDKKSKLNLAVTFGGTCMGEPGTFVGTLKFKAGTGTGTFTDPYASGPYVATHA